LGDLAPAEKRLQKCDWWLNPGMKFAGPEAASANKSATAIFRLHKGADGFVCPKQFKELYRPSFKMMVTGEFKDLKEYCRKSIDVCAPGGGFVLSGDARVDQANPDNLRAMMAAAKEFGTY
jgi:hypothetical protein